jgi:hypothetical protein
MSYARRTTAALLTGTLVLVGTGCGGGGSKKQASATTTTPTTTSTTPTTTTPGTKKHKKKAVTNGPPPLSQTPATTLSYSGTGTKELGVVRIPVDSTLEWTDAGAPATRLFQIIPASVKVQSPVNSRDASGQATIKKGAYHGFLVNTNLYDKWTLKIVPGAG